MRAARLAPLVCLLGALFPPYPAVAETGALAREARFAEAVGAPGDSAAQGSSRALVDAPEQAVWEAVGRVNTGGMGFCTGTLISDRHVMTAAHCVINARTGKLWRPSALHFVAGYRSGRYAAHRAAIRISFDDSRPPLAPGAKADLGAISSDVAILELARPITAEEVRPIPLAAPFGGQAQPVTLYSYGRDRPEALSVQRGCGIEARRGDVLFTDCEATPGVSGAPLIALGGDPADPADPAAARAGARVLGVVSVMGRGGPASTAGARRIGRAIATAADRLGPALLEKLE